MKSKVPNPLGFLSGLACLFVGSVLLFDASSRSDVTQTARVIGSAVLLSLGLITIALLVKDWWIWRKHLKNAEGSVADQSVPNQEGRERIY